MLQLFAGVAVTGVRLRARQAVRRDRVVIGGAVILGATANSFAFFKELGLELEGEAQVEGRSVDPLTGLDGVRADTLGIRRIIFAVEDIDDVVARLGATVPHSLASWCSTRTAIGSVMCVVLRASSSRPQIG